MIRFRQRCEDFGAQKYTKKLHEFMRKFNNGLNRPFSNKVSTYLEAQKKTAFSMTFRASIIFFFFFSLSKYVVPPALQDVVEVVAISL